MLSLRIPAPDRRRSARIAHGSRWHLQRSLALLLVLFLACVLGCPTGMTRDGPMGDLALETRPPLPDGNGVDIPRRDLLERELTFDTRPPLCGMASQPCCGSVPCSTSLACVSGICVPRDAGPIPDKRPADTRSPDTPQPAQGKSCTSPGQPAVSFASNVPPKPCGSVDLTVNAGTAFTWVLGGVKDSKGQGSWKTSAPPTYPCPGGVCTWVFSGLPVPCTAGLFSFNLMKDAVNDNPAVGNIAGSCVP